MFDLSTLTFFQFMQLPNHILHPRVEEEVETAVVMIHREMAMMTTVAAEMTMDVAAAVTMMAARMKKQMILQPTVKHNHPPYMKKTYQTITAVGGVEEDRETVVLKPMDLTRTLMMKDLHLRMELWLLVELLSQPLQLLFLEG